MAASTSAATGLPSYRVDGTQPIACVNSMLAQAEAVDNLPFGAARIAVVGRDVGGAEMFRQTFDTFVGAGRESEQRQVLDAQRTAMAHDDDNADFTREVGHGAALAVQAFGVGNFGEAVRLLRPIRSTAHRFGGSHAQRDVIDLTLIEAARRGGDRALFAALARERAAQRPHSALARRYVDAAG